ncbi:MAG: zinc carboxypeptidase [Candidatus Zixiibacteriota bacterium]|nr:MAG: zinc carboxypeptidase [candidate division Zixibacteria bacterium]
MANYIMGRKLILLIVMSLILSASLVAQPVEHYFRFEISDRQELEVITRVVSISNVEGNTVYAYANPGQLRKFEALGYSYTILLHPGSMIVPRMAPTLEALAEWNYYPSYDQYVAMMYQFESDYPGLCQVYSAGYSVQGREILFARISDNVGVDEEEPEVMYTSTMHGDEAVGYIMMLRLIDSLLTSYGTDPEATTMVNNLDIWINPLANPDGTYITGNSSVAGAIRYNANGVDLNRNFPDPQDGDHPDGNEWQPETVVMMNFAADRNIVLSANFHGGAEVVNYPWDTWPRAHPDDTWYEYISRCYADTVHEYCAPGYMDDLDNGVTNGFDWYEVAGGRQDYMNYWHGGRETTIEVSRTKLVDASTLPIYWEYNRVSLFDYFEKAYYGFRGVVTDQISGEPVAATITVLGHDDDSSQVYSDAVTGNYHRMIYSGTYDIEYSAEDYLPDTVFDLSVTLDGIVTVDVQLMPDIPYVCGDVDDENDRLDLLDIDYFISYLYREGPPPPVTEAADVDGSGQLDILDIDYMIDYLFRGGPEPTCQSAGS